MQFVLWVTWWPWGTLVIHIVWVTFSYHRIGDLDIPREYLVQVSTLFVSHYMVTECSCEALYYEEPPHNGHVVFEVTTHHNRCIVVLAYDITNDICNTVHCFTTLKVAVEQVYVLFRGGKSRPHQVCAQCLHQWCLQVRGGGGPTSTIPLGEWLVWPIPIKIEWVLQLGFVEAHHVSFGPCEEWEQLALLLLCVESPDIQRHQHYLCRFDSVVVVLLAMAFFA